MLLAEAPMIDPGFVIMLLVLLALMAAAMVGIAVGTIVAGHRYGLDPSRRLAQVCWIGGMVVEAIFFVAGITGGGGSGWGLPSMLALAAAVSAWRHGRARSADYLAGQGRGPGSATPYRGSPWGPGAPGSRR